MSAAAAGVAASTAAIVLLLGARVRRRVAPSRDDARRPVEGIARGAGVTWFGRSRRIRVSDDDVAAWCDELARLVRAGSSLAAALTAAPHAPALAPVVAPLALALDRGASVAEATRRVTAPNANVDLALGVVRVCAELGGPASRPLDRAAATLRARVADDAERRTHSAQARLSAVVLTLLPVAALALLSASSAPSRTALATPAGSACVAGGVVLNASGWWWMRRIIGGTR